MTLLYIRTLSLLPEEGPKLNIQQKQQVDGLSKLEQLTCTVQGVVERGALRDGLQKIQRNLHYCSIYNMLHKKGMSGNSCRPVKKQTMLNGVLESPLPLPHPPKKKPSTTYPKLLPIKFPITSVLSQG